MSQTLTRQDLRFLKLPLAAVWRRNWREAREISKVSVHSFILSFIHRMFTYYYVYFSGTVLAPRETAGHKKDKVPDLTEL